MKEYLKFEDFESIFIRENRKLKIILGITLIFLSLIILILIFDKKYFIYQSAPIFEERILAEKICLSGFKSITSNELDLNLIEKDLVKILKVDPYELVINKVLELKSMETNFCKMIIDSNRKLLAFKIGLSASEQNPFFYKIQSIDEIAPDSIVSILGDL